MDGGRNEVCSKIFCEVGWKFVTFPNHCGARFLAWYPAWYLKFEFKVIAMIEVLV